MLHFELVKCSRKTYFLALDWAFTENASKKRNGRTGRVFMFEPEFGQINFVEKKDGLNAFLSLCIGCFSALIGMFCFEKSKTTPLTRQWPKFAPSKLTALCKSTLPSGQIQDNRFIGASNVVFNASIGMKNALDLCLSFSKN